MDLIDKQLDISHQLLEAVRTFPLRKEVEHCGVRFFAPALDFYANCPRCGAQLKLRSSSGVAELEDVFDAVLEWMLQPGADEIIHHRQRAIADEQGE